MRLCYAPIADQPARDAVFLRMQAEGLTACAMSSLASPSLAQWQDITAPTRGVLVGCYATVRGKPAQPLQIPRTCWPAPCSAPGAGGCGNLTSRPSARRLVWLSPWLAEFWAGPLSTLTALPSWGCAPPPTATHGVWPKAAVFACWGACPGHVYTPAKGRGSTACLCSARRNI